jgi:hypothetical protein
MAVDAGTFQTHQAIGNREDLEDIIWDISPTETPFSSAISKIKATAVFHEWQTDALDAAAANAQIEGDDAATNTSAPTVRLRNYCQILSKTPRVADTQIAVDSAGRENEMSYQVMKRMKELKRDLEFALVNNQDSTAGTKGYARRSAGVESWLATNKTTVGAWNNATTPGYSGGTVVSPTDQTLGGTFIEQNLKTIIQLCYTAGGDPKRIMVNPALKARMSTAFTGLATRFRDVPSRQQAQIVAGADVYVSDFGVHDIVPNRFMRGVDTATTGLVVSCCQVLDLDYWALGQLRPTQQKDLAKTGDSTRKQILMEVCLVSRNEKASGKISDISPHLTRAS